MVKENILIEADDTITTLTNLFSSIPSEKINQVPFEGSWTAGQLAKHVVMSISGFAEMMNGEVKDTERAPDEWVERIKKDFLDFTTKMKSPDFIVPPPVTYDKQALLDSLEKNNASIKQAVATLDLEKTCVSFKLPGVGFLTRLEAVYFVIYHTQRHTHQLNNICRELTKI